MIWREGSVVKNHLQLFQGTKFDPQHPPTSSSLQLPISPPPGALTTSSGFCRHWTDVWVHTQKPTYEHMESETLKKYQLNSFSQFCALKWFCKVKIKGRKKCRLGPSWARLLKCVVQSFFCFRSLWSGLLREASQLSEFRHKTTQNPVQCLLYIRDDQNKHWLSKWL